LGRPGRTAPRYATTWRPFQVSTNGGIEPRSSSTVAAPAYDVTPDGRRFVMVLAAGNQEQGDVDLIRVQNWFREVREALRR
jgi:hypothetical protein